MRAETRNAAGDTGFLWVGAWLEGRSWPGLELPGCTEPRKDSESHGDARLSSLKGGDQEGNRTR